MEISRSGDCLTGCVFPSPVEAHRPEDNSAIVEDGPESDDAAADDVDHKANVELSLSKFVNELQTSSLIHRPQEKDGMWVFWKDDFSFSPSSSFAHEIHTKHGWIQEKIKLALCRLNFGVPCVFAQFWAPVTVDGWFYLTTFDQPFALNAMDNGLQEYRKHCLNYKFNIQRKCKEEEDLNGPPSRVFRSQLPESTPCLSYYSIKEYPQRDYAIHCGLKYTYILPVLEPSNPCCVGVLEVVGGADYPWPDYVCNEVRRVLKAVNLTSFIVEDYLEKGLAEGLPHAMDEIKEVLKVVCETHQIRLSQTWIKYGHANAVTSIDNQEESCYSSDLSCTKEVLAKILENSDDTEDDVFRKACDVYPLRKGQGAVGMALLTHKPYFHQDISRLSITEYPFSHYARLEILSSCFSICIKSIHTGHLDYVIEFLMPNHRTDCVDVQTLLGSILATMEQQSRNLKVTTGEELGRELSFQGSIIEDVTRNGRHVVGSEQSNTSFTSYKTISTARTSDQEHTESKQSSESLAASQSTLKSTCRKPDILNGSSYKRIKTIGSLSNLRLVNELSRGVGNGLLQSKEDSSCSNSTFKQAAAAVTHTTPHVTAVQDAEMMTIKAYFGEHIIKFLLPSNSGIADLEKEMTKRLKTLKDGSFSIEYQDCDGDWVLIACDEDLQAYMASSRSVYKTSIMMWIQPKEDGLRLGHASVKLPQEGFASPLTPSFWNFDPHVVDYVFPNVMEDGFAFPFASTHFQQTVVGWPKLKAAIRMLIIYFGIKKRRGQPTRSGDGLGLGHASVKSLQEGFASQWVSLWDSDPHIDDVFLNVMEGVYTSPTHFRHTVVGWPKLKAVIWMLIFYLSIKKRRGQPTRSGDGLGLGHASVKSLQEGFASPWVSLWDSDPYMNDGLQFVMEGGLTSPFASTHFQYTVVGWPKLKAVIWMLIFYLSIKKRRGQPTRSGDGLGLGHASVKSLQEGFASPWVSLWDSDPYMNDGLQFVMEGGLASPFASTHFQHTILGWPKLKAVIWMLIFYLSIKKRRGQPTRSGDGLGLGHTSVKSLQEEFASPWVSLWDSDPYMNDALQFVMEGGLASPFASTHFRHPVVGWPKLKAVIWMLIFYLRFKKRRSARRAFRKQSPFLDLER